MTYIFEEDITLESINGLLEKLDQIDVLYFSSTGGTVSYMKVLIDALNKREDIEVHLFDSICSCATFFLTDYKGKLNTDRMEVVLFHKIDIQTYQLRKTVFNDKQYLEDLKEDNKEYRAKIKKFLTKKQLKKFDKGKDVVVYKKQIQEWKEEK